MVKKLKIDEVMQNLCFLVETHAFMYSLKHKSTCLKTLLA